MNSFREIGKDILMTPLITWAESKDWLKEQLMLLVITIAYPLSPLVVLIRKNAGKYDKVWKNALGKLAQSALMLCLFPIRLGVVASVLAYLLFAIPLDTLHEIGVSIGGSPSE